MVANNCRHKNIKTMPGSTLCAALAVVGIFGAFLPATAQAQTRPATAHAADDAPAQGPSITVNGEVVSEAIRSALPEPAKLNWAEFHAQKYAVTAGEMTITAKFTDGKFQLILNCADGVQVHIHGVGIDDKAIEFTASTAGFQAAIDLADREGNIELPMTITLDNALRTAIHSEKICDINMGIGKFTVHAWIIPRSGSANFTLRLKARYELDGTICVTPTGYDAPMDSCINADIEVRHAPTFHGVLPLNPNRPAEIKLVVFSHAFVFRKTNPLKSSIEQLLNSHFVVGKLAPTTAPATQPAK